MQLQNAFAAHENRQYVRCVELIDSADPGGKSLRGNSALLYASCLAAAGRTDDAIGFLAHAMPVAGIDLSVVRERDDPGFMAIRKSPQWPSLLARGELNEAARLAKLDQAFRTELLARMRKDQAAREAFMAGGTKPEAWKQQVEPIDRDNTAWLKQAVAAKGWPGISMVGEDGAMAAFLLVQHADNDPAFQAHMAALMEAAVARRDTSPSDFALLTDRVLLAQGKPQRYGTQFQTGDDGVMRLRPTQDMPGLEARRQSVGLPPMAEYKRQLSQAYQQPVE